MGVGVVDGGACGPSPLGMRRRRQALSREECLEVLDGATSGVLCLPDPARGYPYQVPLTHARRGGVLVFHCATAGHKLELVRAAGEAGAPVSYCVVGADDVVPEEFTTYFRSVVALGRLRVVSDEAAIRRDLELLGERFWPGHPTELAAEIDGSLGHVLALELEIEELTGKQARELVPRGR